MSIWILSAVAFDVLVFLALAILWIRQTRPAKEDPRLSRGLQLLQSKISVLEDLSDRTDVQVKQLTQILDERAKSLQSKLLNAEEMLYKIEQSMHKSLDVAEIFQEKIPHEEIIERNQQAKYVRAAKLANEGFSVEDILKEVDLPRNEVEFIAKVNRDQLTFNPDLLPEWARPRENQRQDLSQDSQPAPLQRETQRVVQKQELEAKMVDRVFNPTMPDLSALHKIEEDFKKTVRDVAEHEKQEAARIQQIDDKTQAIRDTAMQIAKAAATQARAAVEQAKPLIRKVQFPNIS